MRNEHLELDDNTIKSTMKEWFKGGDKRKKVEETYGKMPKWNVSKVKKIDMRINIYLIRFD